MMPPDEGLFEIGMQLAEVKDHLVVYLSYNVQILDAATANCMAESYRKILEAGGTGAQHGHQKHDRLNCA